MADLRQVTYCGDEGGQTNTPAKTSGICPRNAGMQRRKGLSTDVIVREDRDAVEAVYRQRTPLAADPVEKPELHRLNSRCPD